MFKKNSWIVALLLALTVTALFTGCIDALVEEEGGITYTEVELGDFNVWGGQGYQRGWAVAGMKFLGVGDKAEVTKDLGYNNEDFAKATKLVIEMTDATHPNGNLDLIWGGADENGDSIGLDWVQIGDIARTKDGTTLTIDLTKMKDYAKYRDPTIAKRKIVLQAGAEAAGLPFIVSAKLMIPDVEEPIPPDPFAIPGAGDYTVPDAAGSELVIDLNGAVIGSLTPSANIPVAKIDADKLEVKFDYGTQTIFVAFDKATQTKIIDFAKASYTFDVNISGTQGGHLRWCLGADRAGSWNQTDWGGNGTADSFNAAKKLTPSGADLFGIVIQARPDGNASAIASPYTVTITKITITPNPPTKPVTAVAFGIVDPIAGVPAPTSVSGSGWTGALT